MSESHEEKAARLIAIQQYERELQGAKEYRDNCLGREHTTDLADALERVSKLEALIWELQFGNGWRDPRVKVIIAGTRTANLKDAVWRAIADSGFEISQVVSGGARGVDTLGEVWADCQGIPIRQFPANWNAHGRAAGPIRNREMARYADALIAIWDGQSPGTKIHDRRDGSTREAGSRAPDWLNTDRHRIHTTLTGL